MEDEVKSNELALYSRVYEEHGGGGEVNVLAIVLGLTCGCLLLSGVATTYFCKRYKWCCFASMGRRHGAQVHPYVFSVSRRVSTGRPATNLPQNQSGDGRNAINEAALSRNHNVYSSDPSSSKPAAADGITNQKEAKTGDSLPLSRYVDAVVGRYANVEMTDVVEVDWDEGSFESSQNGNKARVVYTFDPATCADASGLIRLEENETVFVMQSDMGSGWTFIYSSVRDKTGFVPTTALEILDSE